MALAGLLHTGRNCTSIDPQILLPRNTVHTADDPVDVLVHQKNNTNKIQNKTTVSPNKELSVNN